MKTAKQFIKSPCFIVTICFCIFLGLWASEYCGSPDFASYYGYIVSLFNDFDFNLENQPRLLYKPYVTETGYYYDQRQIGSSILHIPSYIASLVIFKLKDLFRISIEFNKGYNNINYLLLSSTNWMLGFFTLFLCYRICRKFSRTLLSFFSVGFCLICSLYFFYITKESVSSELPSVLFTALFFYLFLEIYIEKKDNFSIWVLWGITFGMLLAIKTYLGLLIILPGFVFIKNLFLCRESRMKSSINILLFISVAYFFYFPQAMLMKMYFGKLFRIPYLQPGESPLRAFNLFRPRLFYFLFGPRHGNFLYFPINFIAIYGWIISIIKKKYRVIGVSCLLTFMVYSYFFSCVKTNWAYEVRDMLFLFPLIVFGFLMVSMNVYKLKRPLTVKILYSILLVLILFSSRFYYPFGSYIYDYSILLKSVRSKFIPLFTRWFVSREAVILGFTLLIYPVILLISRFIHIPIPKSTIALNYFGVIFILYIIFYETPEFSNIPLRVLLTRIILSILICGIAFLIFRFRKMDWKHKIFFIGALFLIQVSINILFILVHASAKERFWPKEGDQRIISNVDLSVISAVAVGEASLVQVTRKDSVEYAFEEMKSSLQYYPFWVANVPKNRFNLFPEKYRLKLFEELGETIENSTENSLFLKGLNIKHYLQGVIDVYAYNNRFSDLKYILKKVDSHLVVEMIKRSDFTKFVKLQFYKVIHEYDNNIQLTYPGTDQPIDFEASNEELHLALDHLSREKEDDYNSASHSLKFLTWCQDYPVDMELQNKVINEFLRKYKRWLVKFNKIENYEFNFSNVDLGNKRIIRHVFGNKVNSKITIPEWRIYNDYYEEVSVIKDDSIGSRSLFIENFLEAPSKVIEQRIGQIDSSKFSNIFAGVHSYAENGITSRIYFLERLNKTDGSQEISEVSSPFHNGKGEWEFLTVKTSIKNDVDYYIRLEAKNYPARFAQVFLIYY